MAEAEPPGAARDPDAGLAGLDVPAAPVLLLSAGPSDLPAGLVRRLQRPVATLTADDLPRLEFYAGPHPDGRPDGGSVHAG